MRLKMCVKLPNCSFLEAKRGGRASWGWTSLLVGRDILLRGAHWQIMNGESVRICHDRWIPSLPHRHPIPQGNVLVSRNLRVGSLICGPSRTWDIDFLKPFISDDECKAIIDTSIGDQIQRDRLVWLENKNRVYIVRSGYHCVHSRAVTMAAKVTSTSYSILYHVSKVIWKLKTHHIEDPLLYVEGVELSVGYNGGSL